MALSHFLSSLPPPHPANLTDLLIGLGSMYLVVLALLTPPTPAFKLLRAGIIAPVSIVGFVYSAYWPTQKDYEDIWGTAVLMVFFEFRVLELLVFFPAEENVYRLRVKSGPKSGDISELGDGSDETNGSAESQTGDELRPETIPAPWTIEKFWWASSLWWSWRGIGWNYTCSLSASSQRFPYSRTSPRSAYLLKRATYYAAGWIIHDFTRSFTNVSASSPFFSGRPGAPSYAELSLGQKAVYSICIVTRVWFSMEKSHVLVGLLFVAAGGLLGWEGELWSPWGWPPMYGTLGDLWSHPGLATMWSRVSFPQAPPSLAPFNRSITHFNIEADAWS